jgi:hypothetical protein
MLYFENSVDINVHIKDTKFPKCSFDIAPKFTIEAHTLSEMTSKYTMIDFGSPMPLYAVLTTKTSIFFFLFFFYFFYFFARNTIL